jgi:hypothetical protein
MGYDCTLHLVDEQAIRQEFVPRLLGSSRKKTALDRVMDNAAELWTTVRKALHGDDPEEAAALVCQLAVEFSACSLPHQYERGFALCLWADQKKDIAVKYPGRFAFSPEPLFAEVVQDHPTLKGHFPTWFTGNYSTGVFIPSDRVAEVLAFVEEKVERFAKGGRRRFKGLLGILRAAADKHLAYWEATDLAVPMANEFPGDPKLMIAHYLGNEPGTPGRLLEEAPLPGHFRSLGCSIFDHWLVSADYNPFVTNFWDLSVWPPQLVHALPEFAPYRCRSRDGRWLLFAETDPQARPRNFRPRLYSDLSKPLDGIFPVMVDGAELSIRSGGFVGDRLLVFRESHFSTKAGDLLPPPLWLEGNEWKPVPGLPEVEARPSSLPHHVERPVVGIVPLADANDVVVWDGEGYELRGNHFEKTLDMKAKEAESDWTYALAQGDGFFYLSNRHLFEVHRGGKATARARRWKNIMYIRPGPACSLLLQEGDNKDGDVAKLYFPDEGTFIHVEPELFDDTRYSFITWIASVDRFVVLSNRFLAVPTSAVLSLPRYRASTGQQVKT